MKGNREIRDIMKLLHPLSVSHKLEIISRLTQDIKTNLPIAKVDKSQLLNELYGSWKDMGDDVIEDIMNEDRKSDKTRI